MRRKRKSAPLPPAEDSQGSSTSDSPDKKLRFGNNPIVVLTVGPEKTRFDVHKRQLCELSPFFDAAFNGTFREKAGTMNLAEDDVHAFERFIRWVYERHVDISLECPLHGDKFDKFDFLMTRMREFIDLWILADKYDVPILKNDIIDMLFQTLKHGSDPALHKLRSPRLSDIRHIYANTARGSKLRKFVTACNAWLPLSQFFTGQQGSNWLRDNPEFGTDLAIEFVSRLQGDLGPFAEGKDASAFLEPVESDVESRKR
ncbi:MAG: hypothetical protein Q9199_006519 [Rusavskia elegans]